MIDSTVKEFSEFWDWYPIPYVKDWETLWKLQGPMQPVMRLERESTKAEADAISL